jgi:hypothetical protein
MKIKITLLVDSIINLILGILLLAFNPKLCNLLGIPNSNTNFYPNILGAVLIGITLALAFEAFRKKDNPFIGLGIMGAICINILGGLVLISWLIFGELNLPLRGEIILWILALCLIIISGFELVFNIKVSRHIT